MFKSLSSSLPVASRSFLAARPAQPFASTSAALFSTSPSPAAPAPAPNARPPRKAAGANDINGATKMADVIESYDISQEAANEGSLLASLTINSAIGPRTLSPTRLLEPYPSRPDFTRAHPLGPPTSAALTHDPFVRLGLSPLASPMNAHLRTDFCTNMGKIMSRGKTLLQRGSQRKMAKAVRRARSMGIVATFGKSAPVDKGPSY